MLGSPTTEDLAEEFIEENLASPFNLLSFFAVVCPAVFSVVLISTFFAFCKDFMSSIGSTMWRIGFDCFPCPPPLSAGDTRSKYRRSALDETAMNHRGRKEPIHLFPPCLRASVVQRFFFCLRSANDFRDPPATHNDVIIVEHHCLAGRDRALGLVEGHT